MEKWDVTDSLGILFLLMVLRFAASAIEGPAGIAIAFVGIVIAFLWVGTFILDGFNESIGRGV
jgi:hypothetical protein